MNLSRLGRAEYLAVAGGVLLASGLFLPWYATNPDNRNATIDGATGSVSGWSAHPILQWLLLAAAAAPLILAWIVARDHELSWPRGEVTAVVSMIAAALILYVGLIDRPGEPSGQISLEIGWVVSLLGAILALAGGAIRAGGGAQPRRPPGAI